MPVTSAGVASVGWPVAPPGSVRYSAIPSFPAHLAVRGQGSALVGLALPDVEDLLGGGEDVVAVGVEPHGRSAVVAGGDQLAVVEPGTVGEGDADAVAFEVDESGHDLVCHDPHPQSRSERTPTVRSTFRPV